MKDLRDLQDLTVHDVQPAHRHVTAKIRCSLVTALEWIEGHFDCLRLALVYGSSAALERDGINIRVYRGTSSIKKRPPVGPYSRAMSRALWWS